jgi:hypothetical protein
MMRAALAMCCLVAAYGACNNNGGNGSNNKIVITGLPTQVGTSTPTMAHVAVVDKNGKPVTNYTGTIGFTSTDSVAYLPAQYTFTAADAGGKDVMVTLNTTGMQTVTASDQANAQVKGDATTDVEGPAYYYVPPTDGKIQLVVNQAMSSPTTAVLDLVAKVDLTGYFVGVDVAVDASKVAPDATLMTAGAALSPGTNPAAMAGAVPTTGPLANALVTGLSQKASGNGAVATDTMIAAGSVFYTVTLPIKAGAAAGTIMDGTVAKNKIRAGLRNKMGTEVVGVGDFGIGQLIYKP